MKIYAAYVDYSGRDKYGYDVKLKDYKGFYQKEINCLRACVTNRWDYEEIELKDTCPSNIRDMMTSPTSCRKVEI